MVRLLLLLVLDVAVAVPATNALHALSPLDPGVRTFVLLSEALKNSSLTEPDYVSRALEMTPQDAKLWAKLVLTNNNLTDYFEWGSGGSTEAAAARALATSGSGTSSTLSSPDAERLRPLQVHSADSSDLWFAGLRNRSRAVREAEAKRSLHLIHAAIGDTGDWGWPTGWRKRSADEQLRQGRNYVGAIDLANTTRFGVILVDGRFRVACGLHALLFADANTTLLVHDFYANRAPTAKAAPHTEAAPRRLQRPLGELLKWYNEAGTGEQMAVLSPKPQALRDARANATNYTSALATYLRQAD